MIRALRRKFILISVSSVFIVLVMIAATINITSYIQIESRASEMLEVLSQKNGVLPKPQWERDKFGKPKKMEQDPSFSMRYFSVVLDENQEIRIINAERIPDLTASDGVQLARLALEKSKAKGGIGSIRYQITQKDYGTLIVFLDCHKDFEMFYTFLSNSIFISIVGITAVFGLVLVFSNRAIAPIIESYEKQKQFITDASHELKTPLA
ncbi:MAG: sensor histidine kinase, partial [Cellulosilyticaceae bacterium]